MMVRNAAALFGVSILLGACADAGGTGSFASASLETDDQKASYGVGLNMGSQIADARDRLDRAAFMRGIEDAGAGDRIVSAILDTSPERSGRAVALWCPSRAGG